MPFDGVLNRVCVECGVDISYIRHARACTCPGFCRDIHEFRTKIKIRERNRKNRLKAKFCRMCGLDITECIPANKRYCSDKCRLESKRKSQRASYFCNPVKSALQAHGRIRYRLSISEDVGKRPTTCDSCGREGRICLDHDHTLLTFRGWLCSKCNMALGLLNDDPGTLRNLAEYIERHA